jgi:hypothetical protein
MLDDLHLSCLGVGHIIPQRHKKTSPFLHFRQILCHLIVVAAILLFYLFCYKLRVSPDEKSPNAELIGQLKSSDQPLVLCSVVGGRKLNLNHIFQHIIFGWNEHYQMIRQIINASQTQIHPFSNKICECLRLNRPPGDEFNIILDNFHDPLCDSPHCFFTLEYSSQWAVRYNPNYMR